MVCKALGFVVHTMRMKLDTVVVSFRKGPCFEKYSTLQHSCTMCEQNEVASWFFSSV